MIRISTTAKFFIGILSAFFIGVVIWVVQTTPDESDVPRPKIDPPKEMIYEGGSTISEEKDGKTVWELSADKITVTIENQNAELRNVSAKFYQDDGKEISVRADNGTLHREQKNIYLDGKVVVEMNDGKKITCNEMQWITDEAKLTAIGSVTLNDAETSELKAERVEYFPASNQAVANGNVKFKHADLYASGDMLETQNDFKNFRVTGHARILKGAY